MSKFRSEQQQIDDDALKILRYKFPNQFVFREPEKDFGIDCEFEQFEFESIDDEKKQRSTGVIFKAQVKGVKSGDKLEIKTSPVLSKKLRIRDLEYWYKQLKIPVILFLVDLKTENIYWIEFYSNKKLRDDFVTAKQNNQNEVNVHFPKNQTIPDGTEKLLKAVSNAQQRIALSILPNYSVMEEHFREIPDIDKEINFIEGKLELAYYQRFGKYLDEDIEAAERNAKEILENKNLSSMLKLHVIFSAGRIIYNSNLHKSLHLDRFTTTMVWQVEALHEYAIVADDTHPLVKYTTDLMECILEIRLINRKVLDQRVKADAFGARKDNPLALLSASFIHAFEANDFRHLKDVIDKFNGLVSEQHDFYIQFKATSLTTPMLVQAFVPLRHAYVVTNEIERIQALENYAFDLLNVHAVICELLSDEYLLNQNMSSLFVMRLNMDGNSDFSPAKEIVLSIDDPDFRNIAQEIYDDLIEDYNKLIRSADFTDEMQKHKLSAMALAQIEGYNLEKESDDIEYDDELHKRIHDVLKKGIKEFDLTRYLKDCQYRHIFLPEFSGISPVADSFGLGFASAQKAVMCLKKEAFGTSVFYHLRDTYEKFYNEQCKNCSDIKPHVSNWTYTYEWQRQQDKLYKDFRSETG